MDPWRIGQDRSMQGRWGTDDGQRGQAGDVLCALLSRHCTALGVGEENLLFMRAACMGMANNGMVVWGEQLVSV